MNDPAPVTAYVRPIIFLEDIVGSLGDGLMGPLLGGTAVAVGVAVAIIVFGLARRPTRDWRIVGWGGLAALLVVVMFGLNVPGMIIHMVNQSRYPYASSVGYVGGPTIWTGIPCGLLCGTLLGLWLAGRLRYTTTMAWAAAPLVLTPAMDVWMLSCAFGGTWAWRFRDGFAALPYAALTSVYVLPLGGLLAIGLRRTLWPRVLQLWVLVATLGVAGYGGDGWASLQARVACLRSFPVRVQPVIDAINAYQRDKGHWPQTLDALVPSYLKHTPKPGLGVYDYYEYWADAKTKTWQLRVDVGWGRSPGANIFYAWPKTCPSMDGMDQPLSARIGDWGYYGH